MLALDMRQTVNLIISTSTSLAHMIQNGWQILSFLIHLLHLAFSSILLLFRVKSKLDQITRFDTTGDFGVVKLKRELLKTICEPETEVAISSYISLV